MTPDFNKILVFYPCLAGQRLPSAPAFHRRPAIGVAVSNLQVCFSRVREHAHVLASAVAEHPSMTGFSCHMRLVPNSLRMAWHGSTQAP